MPNAVSDKVLYSDHYFNIFYFFSRTQPKTVFAEVEQEDDETDKPEWKKRKI